MVREFIELPAFTRQVVQGVLDDEDIRAITQAIMDRQGRIDKVTGIPDLWKLRWPNPRRHRGVRGGLRVYFSDYPDLAVSVLILVTDKDLQSDLSSGQRHHLSRLMRDVRNEVENYVRRRLH